jgi:arginyl-tRNA synthetase
VEEKDRIARIVGLGAVKYAELSQHRMTDYVFSWSKMLSLQGNTAPYLQNAYVRVRSIFRKLGSELGEAKDVQLTEPAELNLAKKLLQFGETVPTVLHEFRPNLLANYLFETANAFHAFYEACPVLKSNGVTRHSRLVLCEATARVLKQGLDLLGVEAPERM